MSPSRLKLILAGVVIVVMTVLMLWFPSHAHHAAVQHAIDQADRDVTAARAAADSAAASAARAKDAARELRNRLPGTS